MNKEPKEDWKTVLKNACDYMDLATSLLDKGYVPMYVVRHPWNGGKPLPTTVCLCSYCGGEPQRWNPDLSVMVSGGVCYHCGAGEMK